MTHHNDLQTMEPLQLVRALRLAGRAAEARALAARLSASDDSGCWIGQLGIDLSFVGLHEEAEKHLKRALADESMSQVNRYIIGEELSIVQFILGTYHEANERHRMIRGPAYAEAFRQLILESHPVWKDVVADDFLGMDEPVAGKRIFICAEGGFGDFVQFSRYIDLLLREGARAVVLEQLPGWEAIFRQSDEVTLVMATVEQRAIEIERCNRITFGFSLYSRYQRSPYFPAVNPAARIAVDPAKVLSDEASAHLSVETTLPRVGLIWKSSSGVRHEPYRSMPLERLESVLSSGACRFYSLQVGEIGEAERAVMNRHGVIDMAPHLSTFGDTARVLEKLDLLITVDTGPAHLAGALNRPVWVLLAQACDSRWLDCQRFTPWYPSMRLYRQTELGEWAQPLAEMTADLSAFSKPSSAESP
ncbi:glycosyltransferase family 9 protein [Caballeronia sp. INDeC2]|uniref:glycosyltransferase family 9 protein n=1 Tax=Caballeronia sp. INDeC2 TaxID=2921747 RepID=UPI0020296E9E|nr:glycosyltransferase family 9 protein [Caballeronia sp. INDeC2]